MLYQTYADDVQEALLWKVFTMAFEKWKAGVSIATSPAEALVLFSRNKDKVRTDHQVFNDTLYQHQKPTICAQEIFDSFKQIKSK